MENKEASQTLAKYVFTTDGSCHGYVIENIFDQSFNKLIGLKIGGEDDEKFLPIESVKVFGQDCIFAKSEPIEYDFSLHNNPIGKSVFDGKGNLLGQVSDVMLCGRKIKSIIVKDNEIFAKKVHFIGKNAIILNAKRENNVFSRIRENISENLPKVEIQSPSSGSVKIGQGALGMSAISSPKRIILAPPSLLGKIASIDITGLNNEIIIKKGQTINQQKIDLAKKHGKLNLLIINAK